MTPAARQRDNKTWVLRCSILASVLFGASTWLGCESVCDQSIDRYVERCERCNCGIDLEHAEVKECSGQEVEMLECLLSCYDLPCDGEQYNKCGHACQEAVYFSDEN